MSRPLRWYTMVFTHRLVTESVEIPVQHESPCKAKQLAWEVFEGYLKRNPDLPQNDWFQRKKE